jgi:CheY-like chemotaxis protein/tetratricopeptide (TPR) repeat protein
MGKETLLIADPDPRSRRILQLALRRAGFEVEEAADGRQALEKLRGAGIQAAVCDAALPAPDGIELCRVARAEQKLAAVPFVLVGEERTAAAKARALDAGADDYLAKPVLLKELIQRLQHLLERRRLSDPPAGPAAMTGTVRELGLVDILQSLETWKKSALVRCENGGQLARIWVHEGEVIDAELGTLGGEAAFWRLMTWESGSYRAEMADTELRQPRIHGGTQAALVEAMRRMDELVRIAQKLPMETQLAIDVEKLAERLAILPDEVNGVLRHFDGARSLRAAIDLSPLDDLATVEVVQRLIEDGVLRAASRPPALQQWVSVPPPSPAGERVPPNLVPFPAERGVRRARLRREAEQVRARIAAGEPVRLHRVVEMPARDEAESLGALRRISDAGGEAAKKFAPEAPLARVHAAESREEVPPIAPVAEITPPPELIARRRWRWAAVVAMPLVVLAVLLRLQPHTDRKDAPWLEAKEPVVATPSPAAALPPAPPPQQAAPPPAAPPTPVPPAASPAPPAPEPAGYAEAVTRGNDYFRKGKYRAAAAEYKKAIGLRPESGPVLVALGDAWLEADRPRSAVEPLESASRLDPGSARAQLLLGTAYHSLGRKADASKAYRRFLELDPGSEYAKDVKVILANLGR